MHAHQVPSTARLSAERLVRSTLCIGVAAGSPVPDWLLAHAVESELQGAFEMLRTCKKTAGVVDDLLEFNANPADNDHTWGTFIRDFNSLPNDEKVLVEGAIGNIYFDQAPANKKWYRDKFEMVTRRGEQATMILKSGTLAQLKDAMSNASELFGDCTAEQSKSLHRLKEIATASRA